MCFSFEPNEGLSDQHLAEMAVSDIPARRFDLNETGLMTTGKGVVRVIEITKLVEETRGGGVSVPVEAFEGNNLIFVDEGHKGSGAEWRAILEHPTPVRPVQKLYGVHDPDLKPALPDALLDLE